MRKKLVELLENAKQENINLLNFESEIIADYLLQNGVVVLPCDYGDTVWFIKSAFSAMTKPIAAIITSIRWITREHTIAYTTITLYNDIERRFTSDDIGAKVFLTKEEAEKALERSKAE